jgi:predicted N-acetyltransferase YhbS
MHIHNRPYHSAADYNHMRRLLVEVLARTGPPAYATIGNLDWSRCAEDDPNAIYQVQFWFDGDRLVAFAWPSGDQVEIVVHPDYPVLFEAALAWAEADHHDRGPEAGSSPLRAFSYSRDETRQAVLTARGYRNTGEASVYYAQAIGDIPTAPRLPPGYSIRHVRGEEDAEARAAVQRSAFESTFMTAERHARVRAAPTYRPELDIVVEAPDGTFAAFALVWFDEANRLGVFEPVGTAVDHQRRGLGRAVMVEGLRRLAGLGARVACVQTGVDEEPARRLYQATGFIELDRCYAWARS